MNLYFFLLVYGQWIPWFILHEIKYDLEFFRGLNIPFTLILAGLSPIILNYFGALESYPYHLLIFYLFTALIYYVWIQKKNRSYPFNKTLSLGFLLAFILSYWWEFPIHVVGLMQHGVNSMVIIQATHLLPIPFMFMFIIEKTKSLRLTIKGFSRYMLINCIVVAFLTSVMWLRIFPFFSLGYLILQYSMRFTGLITLGCYIINSGFFRLKYYKKQIINHEDLEI